MGSVISREALEDLRGKYAEILEMRLDHEEGLEDVALVRRRMSALASRFPGALRELDGLELGEIRRRIAALGGVLAGMLEVEPWMPAMAMFHELARGALCAKRWLAGRRQVDAQVRQAYSDAVPSFAFPDDARAWTRELEHVAAPPCGRLSNLVLSRVARQLETNERGARLLVFGKGKHQRPR